MRQRMSGIRHLLVVMTGVELREVHEIPHAHGAENRRRIRSPRETIWRQASSNFWCAVSRRARPSAGVAGRLAGSIALFVFGLWKAVYRSSRLNRRLRTSG